MPESEELAALLSLALRGDSPAIRGVCQALLPVIQARVARTLMRSGRAKADGARALLEDFTQDIALSLFENDAKTLRAWTADRGMSVANFVGLISERHVLSVLRTGKRNPWVEEPTAEESFEALMATVDPEPAVLSRQLLSALWARLAEKVSPKGMYVFDQLYVRQRSVEEVSGESGITVDALYAWRKRLTLVLEQLRKELRDVDS